MFYNKAQTLGEYLMVIALVISALMVMQVYMKRGLQATIKVAADELAPQGSKILNMEKGGIQVSENAYSKEKENSVRRELTSSIKRHAGNIEINSTSQSVYLESEVKGESAR